jgi:protein SCO1/2
MGENLFRTRCAACHTIGAGDILEMDDLRVGQDPSGEIVEMHKLRVGPDLLGVTQKRDPAWLARWLAEPEKMLVEKDPISMELYAKYQNLAMPNMRLNEVEVAALIDYMDTESRRMEGLAD